MNNRFWIYILGLITVFLIVIVGCEDDSSEIITGTLTDIDANVYTTVIVGNQEWMSENLAVTKYNDGEEIPLVINGSIWSNLSTPAYCWYNNNETVSNQNYGALYNWFCVNTGKLCPLGWHVPSKEDWDILIDYVKNDGLLGGVATKLKSTTGWYGVSLNPYYDFNGTNDYGFTALPVGYRTYWDGSFIGIDYYAYWWSSTEENINYAWSPNMGNYQGSDFYITPNMKKDGYSIRCVKD